MKLLITILLTAATCCQALPALLPLSGGSNKPGCSKRANESGLVECFIRTLNHDNLPDLSVSNKQEVSSVRNLRIKCSDKLFFDSFLAPNQTLFQMTFLEQVSIESCKIRNLPSNVWATLSYLRKLRISSRNSDWSTSVSLLVDSEAFQGLNQLTSLDLSQNNIWSLPETIFCPLRSLQKLNVSWNRLSELEELNPGSPEANYCSLNGVTQVDAGFNQLRRIGRIVKWKKLVELRLENNFIEELQDDAFAELSSLKSVNLSSNRLVALPPSIFKFNPALREVYLANNSISALAPAVFSGLSNLVLLDVSRNTLTSQWIREKMFNGLTRLLALRLSFNQLSGVDENIFKDLVNLQTLGLDHNRIESLHPDAFANNPMLRVLDLSHNRLTRLEEKTFGSLALLRQLYLDHNKIKIVEDKLLENCTSLQDLGIADNLLQEVPLALQSLNSLQTLDLGENRITTLRNSSFNGLAQLFGLRLVDNRLTEIPSGFCNPLTKLRVLNLAQNRLRSVSRSSFETCPDLRALRLDTNQLEELPLNLQLPSLLWLNVSENRLNSFNYRAIPSTVEWLDLSHNQLKTITNLPSPKSQLRVLDVSFNQLSSLDATMIPPSLETLRLNQNQVKTVAPDTFIRSLRLRRVELTQNQLESLPLTSLRFSPIPADRPLPEFFLGSNPLKCDCNLEWLTRINNLLPLRQHPRIIDLDTLTCSPILGNALANSGNSLTISGDSSPSSGNSSRILENSPAAVLIRNAPPDQFLCQYKSHCFALCHCCDFDACDCEMICPSNCSCYHDNTWGRNVVQCSSSALEEVPPRIPMDATEIHLDGNNLPTLSSHIFIGKKNLKSLHLNHSRVETIRNKTFNGLKSLQVLHLQGNLLMELHGFEFRDVDNLRELYLQNNLLRSVNPETFMSLTYLQVLRLDGNFLITFNVWQLNSNQVLNRVSLMENPWSCDCEFVTQFRKWIYSHNHLVEDWSGLNCKISDSLQSLNSVCDKTLDLVSIPKSNDEDSLVEISDSFPNSNDFNSNNNGFNSNNGLVSNNFNNNFNNNNFNNAKSIIVPQNPLENQELSRVGAEDQGHSEIFWTLLLTSLGFLILLLVLLVLFRNEIKSRICAPAGGRNKTSGDHDNEKLFDAYFLYSKKDQDLVVEKLTPELETGPNYFRLCLHYRDLILNPENPWNCEMIQSACDASRRVVLVVSSSFFQEWSAIRDFQASMDYVLRSESSKKLIIVVVPPCGREVLGQFLNINHSIPKTSVFEWQDKNFWNKFKMALPPPLLGNSPDHPMLIPATYTISRGGTGDYRRNHHNHHQNLHQQSHHMTHQHHQQLQQHPDGFLPSYQQSLKHPQNIPPPPLPPWQMDQIHPMANPPGGGFVSFNESFKRHQLNQQVLRLQQHHSNSNNNSSSNNINGNSNINIISNNNSRGHSHSHQDSNCSNISNNSRRPLNAPSPGYSSSVETNLSSSSNEELDHVYSTLDSPLQTNRSSLHPMSGSDFPKLINPYSPTNINNNGDPTMYFV